MKKELIMLTMTVLAASAMAELQDDMVLYRGGSWFVHETEAAPNYLTSAGASAGVSSVDSTGTHGLGTDIPLVGDVNGDGIDDVVIVRDVACKHDYIANHSAAPLAGQTVGQVVSGTTSTTAQFGGSVAGGTSQGMFLADVTGNGCDDVVRINNWNWQAVASAPGIGLQAKDTVGAKSATVAFGLAGDQPIMGDFDGDGFIDLGVYRQVGGGIYWNGSTGGVLGAGGTGPVGQIGGEVGDKLLIGDLNGDGFDDAVMYRDNGLGGLGFFGLINDGTGNLNYFNSGTTTLTFGFDTDIPMLADVNGDGMDDIVVNRGDGAWYADFTTAGGVLGDASVDSSATFGQVGDVPLFGQFSIPEPASVGMLVLGSGILWIRKRLMI